MDEYVRTQVVYVWCGFSSRHCASGKQIGVANTLVSCESRYSPSVDPEHVFVRFRCNRTDGSVAAILEHERDHDDKELNIISPDIEESHSLSSALCWNPLRLR